MSDDVPEPDARLEEAQALHDQANRLEAAVRRDQIIALRDAVSEHLALVQAFIAIIPVDLVADGHNRAVAYESDMQGFLEQLELLVIDWTVRAADPVEPSDSEV